MTQVCSDGRNEAKPIVLVKLFQSTGKKHKVVARGDSKRCKWKEKATQICTYDDILYKLIDKGFHESVITCNLRIIQYIKEHGFTRSTAYILLKIKVIYWH